jgi:hypothetical protein
MLSSRMIRRAPEGQHVAFIDKRVQSQKAPQRHNVYSYLLTFFFFCIAFE